MRIRSLGVLVRAIAFLTILVSVAISAYLLVGKPPGYCYKKGRVLSDEELFFYAVTRNKDDIARADLQRHVEALRKRHPDCCSVSKRWESNEVFVSWTERDFVGEKMEKFDYTVVVDRCGEYIVGGKSVK